MKRVLKIVRSLVKPLNHRGFSRVDLVIVCFLGMVVIADLLLHAFLPASIARASLPAQAQAQTGQQADVPSTSTSLPASPPVPCTVSTGPSTPLTPMHLCPASPPSSAAPSTPTNFAPCASPTSYSMSEGNVADPFGGNNFLFFFTDPSLTVNECHITALVGVLTFAVNTAMVLVFVLLGIRLMLGGSVIRHASAIELFPTVVLTLLAANLCLPIMALSLTFNNSLIQFVYGTVNNMPASTAEFGQNGIVTKTCDHWDTLTGGILGMLTPLGPIGGALLGESIGCNQDAYVTNWQHTLNSIPSAPNITQGASIGGFLYAFSSLSDLLQFMLGITVLMLMGQMAMRLLFLDLFIATAPLGLAASALPGPGGKLVTKLWLQGFFTTLFVQFLQVMALIIARLVIGVITSGLYASFNGPNATNVNNDATLLWVMQLAQYWFILRVPGLLRLGPMSPMNMVMEFGQTMATTAQTAVQDSMTEIQMTTSMISSVVGLAIAGAGLAM